MAWTVPKGQDTIHSTEANSITSNCKTGKTVVPGESMDSRRIPSDDCLQTKSLAVNGCGEKASSVENGKKLIYIGPPKRAATNNTISPVHSMLKNTTPINLEMGNEVKKADVAVKVSHCDPMFSVCSSVFSNSLLESSSLETGRTLFPPYSTSSGLNIGKSCGFGKSKPPCATNCSIPYTEYFPTTMAGSVDKPASRNSTTYMTAHQNSVNADATKESSLIIPVSSSMSATKSIQSNRIQRSRRSLVTCGRTTSPSDSVILRKALCCEDGQDKILSHLPSPTFFRNNMNSQTDSFVNGVSHCEEQGPKEPQAPNVTLNLQNCEFSVKENFPKVTNQLEVETKTEDKKEFANLLLSRYKLAQKQKIAQTHLPTKFEGYRPKLAEFVEVRHVHENVTSTTGCPMAVPSSVGLGKGRTKRKYSGGTALSVKHVSFSENLEMPSYTELMSRDLGRSGNPYKSILKKNSQNLLTIDCGPKIARGDNSRFKAKSRGKFGNQS